MAPKPWLVFIFARDQDIEADTTADHILRRTARSFHWQSDWPKGMSRGSYGHPFLCRAPCVYAIYGNCMKGPRPQWPTGFEFRMAFEQMWNLRSFSLGRLMDFIQQCPQVDASFRQEVKDQHAVRGLHHGQFSQASTCAADVILLRIRVAAEVFQEAIHCLKTFEQLELRWICTEVAPFVECSSTNRRQLRICRDQEIENYPTWIINGEKYLGGRDLSELVELSGFTEYPAERFKRRDTSVMEYIWGPPENV
eukprot:s1077_g3.t1